MKNIAIRAENLSKFYKIGTRRSHDMLRDQLAHGFKALFFRNGQSAELSLGGNGLTNSGIEPQPDYIWALKDASFEVRHGEVIGFVGRNGAGKSTLLKILSRITEPTSGRANVYGRIGSLLEVGTGFHSELTGRENIYLNGAILGMRKTEIDRQFDEIVDFADIEKFIDTPVKRYSSGMYVRIAFAVAAHLESEILIVDEVLAVGDAAFQRRCLGKMNAVANEGKTVLFVSHNADAIQRLTQRTLWLENGRIISDGPTAEIVTDYLKSSLPASPGLWDAANVSHRSTGLSQEVEFLRLEFENHEGGRFPAGSDLPLRITIRSKISIEKIRFGMTILRMDGIPVGSFFVPIRARVCANESAVFLVELRDLRLAPGRFYLNISVGGSQNGPEYYDFDTLSEVLNFEILPFSSAENLPSWQPSWGSVLFPRCTAERIG